MAWLTLVPQRPAIDRRSGFMVQQKEAPSAVVANQSPVTAIGSGCDGLLVRPLLVIFLFRLLLESPLVT